MNPDTNLEEYTQAELRILGWCKDLACSQGFYGRLYRDLRECREYLQHLAEQNFTDMLSFILYVEEGE